MINQFNQNQMQEAAIIIISIKKQLKSFIQEISFVMSDPNLYLPMIATSGGLPGNDRGTDFQSEALKRNFPSRLNGYGLPAVKLQ